MMLVAEVRTAKGQVLGRLFAHEKFNPVLLGIDIEMFPMLGSIDPYGDTAFNYLQVQRFLVEIQTYERDEAGFDEFLRDLEVFCSEALRKPHRFLWFVGD